MIRLFVSALILSLGFPTVALAQTAATELEIEIGLDGWVDRSRPVPIEATIQTELLFAGTLVLQNGQSVVEIPIEVPAAGRKSYEVLITATMADGPILARLMATGIDEPIADLRVRPQEAIDSVLVGTLGVDGLQLPARTAVADLPIVEIPIEDLSVDLAPLDYLVIGDSFAASDELLDWVAAGGHLIVDSRQLDDLDLVQGTAITGNGLRFESGRGQVLALESLNGEWTHLIEPPRVAKNTSEVWSQPDALLARSASNSVPNALTSTGILFGLAIYALVAAPLNLVVLKRLRKRELAWITVPALGLVTLIVLALFGGLRPQSSQFAHSTLLVGGLDQPGMHSVVVGAADGSTSHLLEVESDSTIYPGAGGDPVGGGAASAHRRVVSASELALDFKVAGYGTAGVLGPAPGLPKLTLESDGNTPSLTIANDSSLTLLAYGVVSGPNVSVGDGTLEPGAMGSVLLENVRIGTADEAAIEALQDWNNSRWWEVYRPLASVANQQLDGAYFFGFVERFDLPVTIDGRLQEIEGPAMVVIPLTDAEFRRADARLVAISPGGRIQGESPWIWIEGEWGLVRFDVPIDRSIVLEVDENFGAPLVGIEAWDRSSGEFIEIELGEIDQSRFVDGDGQLLVRVSHPIEDEFMGSPLYPQSLFVSWDSP